MICDQMSFWNAKVTRSAIVFFFVLLVVWAIKFYYALWVSKREILCDTLPKLTELHNSFSEVSPGISLPWSAFWKYFTGPWYRLQISQYPFTCSKQIVRFHSQAIMMLKNVQRILFRPLLCLEQIPSINTDLFCKARELSYPCLMLFWISID